jgi:hypothetical protein
MLGILDNIIIENIDVLIIYLALFPLKKIGEFSVLIAKHL